MLPIFREFSIVCAGLFAGVAFASSAAAQPSQLAIAADKDWEHQWTSMTFPAEIDGFQREEVLQYEERQTNVSSRYWDEETQTILSLYIYRPGNPDVAIWFDRALIAIGAAENYGEVDLDQVKIQAFIPNGGSALSGQYAVLEVDGNFRSTSVALFQAEEWLVKVRISSVTLSVRQMQQLTQETLSKMHPMAQVSESPTYLVEPCENTMEFTQAIPFDDPKGDLALALEVSASVMRAHMAPADRVLEAAELKYCRNGPNRRQFAVYRANNSTSAYTVAIGDSGKSFSVFEWPLYGAEPGGSSAVSAFRVQSSSGLTTSVYRPFIGLPNIRQASEVALGQQALAEVNRPLGDEAIEINLIADP